MERAGTVDVIIPVYLPDSKLELLLERMKKQTIPPNKIILMHTVVPGKESILIPYQEKFEVEVHDISKNEFDHGRTRNAGAGFSNAEYILFMTQDAVPEDKHLIENLLNGFSQESIGICYARQLPGKHSDEIERFTRNFNYSDEDIIKSEKDMKTLGIKAFFCSDVCAVYRRKYFDEIGGFVEKTIFNEDAIMAYYFLIKGYQVHYVSSARVIHAHKYTYRQQFTRNFDLGVSHAQYSEIFEAVKSETEGIKLVKDTLDYLCKSRRYWKIPDLIFTSGFKFLGYRFGKKYRRLPKGLVVKLSMNKGFWNEGK
ncbi:glycosyltransferase family 2 protein [Anaeromicropila populeti]|uniref:Rhamnosyltransferase n=1 Tax=Anaeromicropila populeti TaxID=37658 RepID=A0A1I6KQE9_9FIRM|nr:glycosyltransferase [Anaeromicropila populeti]SFR93475.1 rhamnosyltransferase [Anaeromicropila populeti]